MSTATPNSNQNSNLNFSFKNKNAVVTGSAQGIGFQIALSFLQAGGNVAIWDYSEAALENAKKELAQYSAQTHFAQVDVTKTDSCENVLK